MAVWAGEISVLGFSLSALSTQKLPRELFFPQDSAFLPVQPGAAQRSCQRSQLRGATGKTRVQKCLGRAKLVSN